MTAEEYERLTGHAPEQDDLERVNCDKVGQIGHWSCGWCEACNQPRFYCGCLVSLETIAKKGDATFRYWNLKQSGD